MKIDGKQIAQEILDNLKKQTEKLKKAHIYPKLAIILVGDDSGSASYVNQKEIKAELIGTKITVKHFPSQVTEETLIETINNFNDDKEIHGIIVQQPLPKQINPANIVKAIDPKKDVDGFHQDSHFQMPIALAVLKVLEKVYTTNPKIESHFVDWLRDKKIVVIGKGETGGKPILRLFEKMKVPVTSIDSKTEKPENLTKIADIIISAVGKSNVIKPEMLKRGVVLIGIGIARGESAKLTGDYDQNEVKDLASFYTPTPGGIGPINVAFLLKNLIDATVKP